MYVCLWGLILQITNFFFYFGNPIAENHLTLTKAMHYTVQSYYLCEFHDKYSVLLQAMHVCTYMHIVLFTYALRTVATIAIVANLYQ